MSAGVTILQVADVVATGYGRSVAEICADLRDKEVVRARHMTYWLARKLCGADRGVIARALGGRDPGTVAAGIAAIDRLIRADEQLALEAACYETTIRSLADAKLLEKFAGFDALALARSMRMNPRAAIAISVRDTQLMAAHVLRVHETLERAAQLVRLLASPDCRDDGKLAAIGGFLAIDLEALGLITSNKDASHV